MSTSMIWIRALSMQTKYVHRTCTSKQLFQKFTSRLIAYLKKKENETPKYLSGMQKNGFRRKSNTIKNED
jgi:hypothetical protein